MNDKLNQRPSRPKVNKDNQSNISPNKDKRQSNSIFYDNSKEIVETIKKAEQLRNYPIRVLVKQAEILGGYLNEQKLKTNQIRKFLDAINRVKFELAQINDNFTDTEIDKLNAEIVMLKPKLVYAVGKNKSQSKAIKSLEVVLKESIDRIEKSVQNADSFDKFKSDFTRLVQLIESIVAYHKAQGGE